MCTTSIARGSRVAAAAATVLTTMCPVVASDAPVEATELTASSDLDPPQLGTVGDGADDNAGDGGCPADVNGDGRVNIEDLLEVLTHWGGSGEWADVNLDGLVDVSDLLIVLMSWGDPGGPADVNRDGTVDVIDLLTVFAHWERRSGPADIDDDGVVNTLDLLEVLTSWGPCSGAPTLVWSEDFSLGNYSRWSGEYFRWSSCADSGFVSDEFVSPNRSHRSEVTCPGNESHRGYGGLRFEGDTVLPSFHQASSGGIDSRHGIVITFWTRLSVDYTFSPTRWLSLLTVTDDCSNAWHRVVTINLDNPGMVLKPVHVHSRTPNPNAPSFPIRQWTRTTIYLNYYEGYLHIWQDGQEISGARFSPQHRSMCQVHWGLYASGSNHSIRLYEDDLEVWKLNQPWTDFTREPRF